MILVGRANPEDKQGLFSSRSDSLCKGTALKRG